MKRRSKEDLELWERVKKTATPLRSNRAIDDFQSLFETGVGTSKDTKDTANHSVANRSIPARIVRPYVREVPEIRLTLAAKPPLLDEPTSKKIAKGKLSLEGRIDLHGMTQTEAHSRLFRFVDAAHLAGKRTVLVITGKGARGEGILRQAVPRWLSEPLFRKRVIGFREAHVNHGGGGALYLRIRKPDKT